MAQYHIFYLGNDSGPYETFEDALDTARGLLKRHKRLGCVDIVEYNKEKRPAYRLYSDKLVQIENDAVI